MIEEKKKGKKKSFTLTRKSFDALYMILIIYICQAYILNELCTVKIKMATPKKSIS